MRSRPSRASRPGAATNGSWSGANDAGCHSAMVLSAGSPSTLRVVGGHRPAVGRHEERAGGEEPTSEMSAAARRQARTRVLADRPPGKAGDADRDAEQHRAVHVCPDDEHGKHERRARADPSLGLSQEDPDAGGRRAGRRSSARASRRRAGTERGRRRARRPPRSAPRPAAQGAPRGGRRRRRTRSRSRRRRPRSRPRARARRRPGGRATAGRSRAVPGRRPTGCRRAAGRAPRSACRR